MARCCGASVWNLISVSAPFNQRQRPDRALPSNRIGWVWPGAAMEADARRLMAGLRGWLGWAWMRAWMAGCVCDMPKNTAPDGNRSRLYPQKGMLGCWDATRVSRLGVIRSHGWVPVGGERSANPRYGQWGMRRYLVPHVPDRPDPGCTRGVWDCAAGSRMDTSMRVRDGDGWGWGWGWGTERCGRTEEAHTPMPRPRPHTHPHTHTPTRSQSEQDAENTVDGISNRRKAAAGRGMHRTGGCTRVRVQVQSPSMGVLRAGG